MISTELSLSPEGNIYLSPGQDPDPELKRVFSQDVGHALLHLGLRDFKTLLSSSGLFWQHFARKLIARLCQLQYIDHQGAAQLGPPGPLELEAALAQAPPMQGGEYLSIDVLSTLWNQTQSTLNQELASFSGSIQEYLNQYSSRWNQVGRVCFHLAENKNHEQKPFAFLATYTTLGHQTSTTQHLPLKRALHEFSADKTALLSLLLPVQKAAETSSFVKELVETKMVFEASAWTAKQAHQFLQAIPQMEASGVSIRVPNWWNPQTPSRLKTEVRIGTTSTPALGLSSLLTFDVQLAYEGEPLTKEEWQQIQKSDHNFVNIKGKWVEVDRDKLDALLSQWQHLKTAHRNGLSMAESLRLLAGINTRQIDNDPATSSSEWLHITASKELQTLFDQIKHPQYSSAVEDVLRQCLRASLRPYQKKGVLWLWTLYNLRLGSCLADDMGLGKTIQILALLLTTQAMRSTHQPHLLVVPASLLGNWIAEIERFAPTLTISIAHSSSAAAYTTQVDLVITTYGFLQRTEPLQQTHWDLVILDEAQSIKNPTAKQTLAVKKLISNVRIALTGTPIENCLGDLWSLFDFTSPGLLGPAKVFANYSKQPHFIASLRKLTQPYILRRLKSDKTIIADLPEKTEMKAYCHLSKEQIRLYTQSIEELNHHLQHTEGIQRRGIILSYLMRFKQICNHPAQSLGFGEFAEQDSGKWMRLRTICEEIAAKQEKVLIFTQFKEIMDPLFLFLTGLFKREGLMLHGATPVQKRASLVQQFQQDLGPPFFLLSVKAGGTGLNLTKASHVIHFDRWWNPAVENQATDRAYRIGQKHPVFVHPFICRGTIEEKIDALIESKKNLSKELLEGQSEVSLTELANDQLMQMVSLDLKRAMGES